MDGEITKIFEVKILIYLLGLLQIHEKRKTAEILWRNGFGVIRIDISKTLATLLLVSLAKRFISYQYDQYDMNLYLTISGFISADLSI